MSRGPGKILRAIEQAIEKSRVGFEGKVAPVIVGSHEIAARVFGPPFDGTKPFGPQFEPSRTQMQSVTRAMRAFVLRHQQYALRGGRGRRALMLYEPGDIRSRTRVELAEQGIHVPQIRLDAYIRGDLTLEQLRKRGMFGR
jgi:hypothetical protein